VYRSAIESRKLLSKGINACRISIVCCVRESCDYYISHKLSDTAAYSTEQSVLIAVRLKLTTPSYSDRRPIIWII